MIEQDEPLSFQDRLKAFIEEERKKTAQLPPGAERDQALQKIRQAKAAAHLDASTQAPASPTRPLSEGS